MSSRFWIQYLLAAVFTISVIGFCTSCRHRVLFAESIQVDGVQFTAAGLADQVFVIHLDDASTCQSMADGFAHDRDGAPELTHEGFTAVECNGFTETITKDEHPSDDGTGVRENDPNG